MPVEFLTDAEAASYGRYNGPPPRTEMERAFFLDDAWMPGCGRRATAPRPSSTTPWRGCWTAVLLPGVTTLARPVAQVRDEATQRLWETLYGLLTARQRAVLERLVEVPDGARVSDLERWRKGPAQPSGKNLEKALGRVAEITAVGLGKRDLDAVVPRRRLVDLACYGMAAKAP